MQFGEIDFDSSLVAVEDLDHNTVKRKLPPPPMHLQFGEIDIDSSLVAVEEVLDPGNKRSRPRNAQKKLCCKTARK